ncbi:hypothetical protein [Pelagibacterium montanilacus]|uniref:hypothetical protein n=1 Tax=Pelagibacterium montanilacus TaxID=2185280 RepID=UPI000F8E471D|nr:hypothetical protein [Pelagibacterium montanilacus]
MIINKTLYPVPRNVAAISTMQKQMDGMLEQLSSGKRYNTLAESGQDRLHSLNLRARLSRIEGYSQSIKTVETRLSFQTNALDRLSEIKASAKGIADPGALGNDGLTMAASGGIAQNLLREVVDVLNTDLVGRYVFSGNASDTKPVATYDALMHGDGVKAGFLDVRTERQMADGVANGGRVDTDASGALVTLTEDGDHPFGLKISTVTGGTAGPADSASPAGARQALFDFSTRPAAGEEITIGLTLPDDRSKTVYVTLKATNETPPPAGRYLTSDDPATTAANFRAALKTATDDLSRTRLDAASTYAAADAFFTAPGEAVMRHDAGPPEALVADTNHDRTVQWYRGQDVGPDANPRDTVSTGIDESTRVGIGIQANERGIAELVRGLAVFAVTDFSENNQDRAGQYEGLVATQRDRLSSTRASREGSIEMIAMEMGLASNTLDKVKSRHTQYDAQLNTMLAGIEEAPVEEVAMMLMTLQTRLNASYQVTAMVSQLSLVNYLR